MDVACPSLPLNVLTDDKLRPVRRHTPRMAADGCHLATCFSYVLLVMIEIFFLTVRDHAVARTLLYKTRPPILSSTFLRNALASLRLLRAGVGLPMLQWPESSGRLSLRFSAGAPPILERVILARLQLIVWFFVSRTFYSTTRQCWPGFLFKAAVVDVHRERCGCPSYFKLVVELSSWPEPSKLLCAPHVEFKNCRYDEECLRN
jgi:hypothetical protein